MDHRRPLNWLLETATAAVCASAILLAASAGATSIVIQFTGVNLQLENDTLSTGGEDEIFSADVFRDGALVGSLDSSDEALAVDLLLSPVSSLMLPGMGETSTADAGTGTFNMAFGAQGDLSVDVSQASVALTVVDSDSTTLDFVFVAGAGAAVSGEIPFVGSVAPDSPITLTISTQGMDAVRESSGVVTGFETSGTGEISIIPEPATAALLLIGLAGLAGVRRRTV